MKQNYKKRIRGIAMSSLIMMSASSYGQLYSFSDHTFTNASSIGKDGPTLLDCQTAYSAESWELNPAWFNMTTQGIQEWTVPVSGDYKIEAYGAQGGNDLYTVDPEDGGLGTQMIGTFSLVEGDILYILVGQKGEDTRVTDVDNAAAGGGGGTYVWDPTDTSNPLIAAGGGAGGSGQGYVNRNSTDGIDGFNSANVANGGIGGNGGRNNNTGSSYWAGGGSGWLTNGTGGRNSTDYVYTPGSFGAEGGRRPLEGGMGGTRVSDGTDEGGDGGFGGGGGGGSDNMGTGGGGGYSGGGGDNGDGNPDNSGGGGGSYNAGIDQDNIAAINSGMGAVTITLLCDVLTLAVSGTEFCDGDLANLAATSSNGGTITWDMGIDNGIDFTPSLGTTIYTATSDHADDCEAQVEILVHALPTVTAYVDDEEICIGDEVVFTHGGDADTYTWDMGVTEGISFEPVSVGTITYTVTGEYTATGCENTASVEVLVNDLPTIIASVDEDDVCEGVAFVFTGSGGDTYTWDMGVTDGVGFVATVGSATYTVTGTDGNGCVNTGTIDATVHALPTVIANVDETNICFGETLVFTGGGADTYVWDMGVTDGVGFVSTTSGTITYTVTGTDGSGCENTDNIDVTIAPEIVVTVTTIDDLGTADGEIDITVTGGVPTYTFDWDNDGTGDFDDTEDLTGLIAGTYTVVIKDDNGCETRKSFEVESQVGIAEIESIIVAVYPNPTNGDLTIEIDGDFNYQLVSINGAVLLTGSAIDKELISIHQFADGIYFMTVKAGDSVNTIKIVKK